MKTCTKCGETKPVDEFYVRRSRGGRQAHCKACQAAYRKANPELRAAAAKRRATAAREWLWVLKGSLPCTDCGSRYHPASMQFDHLPGSAKSFGVTVTAVTCRSRADIEAEIAKCEIVCANCHAVRTWSRQQKEPTNP